MSCNEALARDGMFISMYATCVECEEKEETHLAFLCIDDLERAVFYLAEGF